jgi:GR25 family glycosyltransferase involved in LPS biosynthesis
MLPSYVINLDRLPERLASFQKWNAISGLRPERFAAIDGRTADPNLLRSVARNAPNYTPGALACGLSHQELWKRVAKSDRPAIILEDDAVLRADTPFFLDTLLMTMPADWDIILLGYNTDAMLTLKAGEVPRQPLWLPPHPTDAMLTAFQKMPDFPRAYGLANAMGTCAYVISPAGAATLLRLCFPMDNRTIRMPGVGVFPAFGLDSMLNAFYDSIKAFVTLPLLAMTPNTSSETAAQPAPAAR